MRLSKTMASILSGAFLLVFGLVVLLVLNSSYKGCSVTTTATIVENVARESTDSDGDDQTHYFPVVEYMVGSKKVRAEYNVGTGSVKYEVGDLVEIQYDPDNTDNFKISGDNSFAYVSYGCIAIGAVILIWRLIPLIIYFVKKQ